MFPLLTKSDIILSDVRVFLWKNNYLHQNVCPEETTTMKGGIKHSNRSMLCMRWRRALRNRHTGAGFKPPLGAAVKSCGIERKGKGWYISQVCAMELNESEQPMQRRYKS